MTGIAIDLVSKATLILFAACGLAALMRRASAAARHVVWAAALAALLVLPAGRAVLPALHVPVLPPAAASGQRPLRDASVLAADAPAAMPSAVRTTAPTASGGAATGGRRDWARTMMLALGTIWIFGVGALVWRGFASVGALRRVTRAAEVAVAPELARRVETISSRFGLRRPVRVIVSHDQVMPVTWGIAQPVLLLPAAAFEWQTKCPSRLDAVLIHELAHVARWDALSNALGQIGVTLLWFHPLAWHAARRSRLERERACDDIVVSNGVRASDYASDLVTLARTFASPGAELSAALHISRPSHLEARVNALLDARVNRRRVSWRAMAIAAVGTLAIALLGTARLAARIPEPERIAAVTLPASGAVVPVASPGDHAASAVAPTPATPHTRQQPSAVSDDASAPTSTSMRESVIAPASAIGASAAPTGIAGAWIIPYRNGNFSKLVLAVDGTKVTGTMSRPERVDQLTGSYVDGRLTFNIAYDPATGFPGAWGLAAHYWGQLESEQLAGTYATDELLGDNNAFMHHTGSWTATRIPASATALQIQRPMAPALAELLTEALALPGIMDVLKVTAAHSGPVSPPVTEQPIADPYRAPGTTAPKIDMSGITEPKRQQEIIPIYPGSAIDAGIQGSCTAEAIIDHEGHVVDAHVVSGGAPALNAATLDAVRQWRYSPALINGDPKAILITINVRYQLK